MKSDDTHIAMARNVTEPTTPLLHMSFCAVPGPLRGKLSLTLELHRGSATRSRSMSDDAQALRDAARNGNVVEVQRILAIPDGKVSAEAESMLKRCLAHSTSLVFLPDFITMSNTAFLTQSNGDLQAPDPDEKDKLGRTAMHLASWAGHADVIRWLFSPRLSSLQTAQDPLSSSSPTRHLVHVHLAPPPFHPDASIC